uniref:cysteine dioxygenase n=1 Tax=Oryza sativa subsp. japonica TaxID=39947 RepID=Q2QVT9_ORYSJ|nr:hypothetical protein LOC_Os12g11670 [Oryza sativa Japonica Group]
MPPLLGIYVFTDRLAFAAADWCFRLHGWPLCRRCWAPTSSPTGRLVRRRLVLPPARLAFMPPLLGVYVFTDRPPRPPTGVSACTAGLYAAVVGRLRLHRPAASSAADWCFRLHGWALCRRCWASTSSPTGRLVRRRLVFSPARLAFMPPLLGVYVFTDRLAFVAADWCPRLHGWPIMPPLLGAYVFTDRLAFAAADWCFRLHGWPLCRRCWASTSSPTGRLVRRRLVFLPARLAFMPPLLGVYVFTDWPPRPPPTGASACTAGLYVAVVGRLRLHRPAASTAADWCFRLRGWPLCRRCWASTSSPTGRLVRRRLVLPPARLAFMPPLLGVYVFTDRPPRLPPTGVSACTAGLYAAVVGRLRLHRPAASTAADWCFRLHGWPLCRRCWASTSSPTGRLVRRRLVLPPARLGFMPPLLGVYVFADRPPRPPPTGVFACTAGLYAAVVGRLCLHRPACLRRRRLVSSPARLAHYAAVVGRLRLHRPACLRRRRLVFPPARLAFMPPLLGVYVFTDRPPLRRRLVLPPARLAFMSPLLGVYVFTDRPPRLPPTGVSACAAGLYVAVVGRLRLHRPAASSAADWCFRLHGWPLCRRCWASTSSPTGRLDCRRLVFPPARLAFMPPLLGVYVFTDWLAFAAADWCFRLHGWPLCRRCWASTSSPTGRLVRRRLVLPPARLAFMPPLLGVYVFTDRPPRPPLTGVSACTAGLLCCRCWASTSSLTGRLVRRRLVLPPARLAFMSPLLGVYVFTDRPPRLPPTGVSACTAGLYAAVVGRLRLHRPAASTAADWCFRLHGWPLCRRCWASTSSPTGRLDRRRLVFPPARLAYYAAVVGRLRLHRLAASSADCCFRLHGWPLCRRCWASTSSPTGRRIRR